MAMTQEPKNMEVGYHIFLALGPKFQGIYPKNMA